MDETAEAQSPQSLITGKWLSKDSNPDSLTSKSVFLVTIQCYHSEILFLNKTCSASQLQNVSNACFWLYMPWVFESLMTQIENFMECSKSEKHFESLFGSLVLLKSWRILLISYNMR